VAIVTRKFQKWGITMSIDTSNANPNMDYAEHQGTYGGFIKLTQVAVVLLVILLAAMFVFLVPAPGVIAPH
jgi:hypothetical protein